MAISVSWADVSPVILVPRADMPVIQVSPEVRELDLDSFRLELKDLEANRTEGIVWPDTHAHITESVLSGITYARTVRVLSPYQVEFEDGQYIVSVVGGNTNIGDVKVANQVSLIVNNSAGLVNLNNILATLNYQNYVWIDTLNGSAGTIKGVNGIPANPSNNLTDALSLAGTLGFRSLRFVSGSLTLTQDLEDYEVILGRNTILNFGGFSVDNSEFTGGVLTGTMTGGIQATQSTLQSISGMLGEFRECGVDGTLTLATGQTTWDRCYSDVAGTSTPVIDFVGAGRVLSNRGYAGGLDVRNMNDVTNIASLDYVSGQLLIDSSCSAGTLVYRDGIAPVTDNSTGTTIVSGTAADRLWGAAQTGNVDANTMGELLDDAATKAALAAALSAK